MTKNKISVNEYYHLFNRGNDKQKIFIEERDWIRFLFLIIYFQSPTTSYLNNISRHISNYVEHRMFNMSEGKKNKVVNNKYIELISFCIMPNHFHIIAKELKENGISKYMQRVLNAYTKYFNTKYDRSGHLFQGAYKYVHIKNNEQLLHLSSYIHRNPRELKGMKNKEHNYNWSSYQDYINTNRWSKLLDPEIILDQFSETKKYKEFCDTSGTKLNIEEKIKLD